MGCPSGNSFQGLQAIITQIHASPRHLQGGATSLSVDPPATVLLGSCDQYPSNKHPPSCHASTSWTLPTHPAPDTKTAGTRLLRICKSTARMPATVFEAYCTGAGKAPEQEKSECPLCNAGAWIEMRSFVACDLPCRLLEGCVGREASATRMAVQSTRPWRCR